MHDNVKVHKYSTKLGISQETNIVDLIHAIGALPDLQPGFFSYELEHLFQHQFLQVTLRSILIMDDITSLLLQIMKSQ